MAQWYAQLVFIGDTFLGDSLADWSAVSDVLPPDAGVNGRDRYTNVIVSGYALYGQLRGYYALGVAQIVVDPADGQAHYLSEASARHQEPANSLTAAQRTAVRNWLIGLNPEAWENSAEAFRSSLDTW